MGFLSRNRHLKGLLQKPPAAVVTDQKPVDDFVKKPEDLYGDLLLNEPANEEAVLQDLSFQDQLVEEEELITPASATHSETITTDSLFGNKADLGSGGNMSLLENPYDQLKSSETPGKNFKSATEGDGFIPPGSDNSVQATKVVGRPQKEGDAPGKSGGKAEKDVKTSEPLPEYAPKANESSYESDVLEDQSFSIDASQYFTDENTDDILTYSLGVGAPSWLSIDAKSGMITGMPANDVVGDIVLNIFVTDRVGQSAKTTLELSVANVNDAPTSNTISNANTAEDLAFSYDVSGSFDDVDLIHGDSLTYSLEGSPPGWLSINASTGEITGTPTNGDVGVTTITVRVTDGSGETAQTNFDLTVDNVNDVPTVSSIANNTATEDLAFSYDVSGSFDDVDLIHGDTLTYSLEGSPPGWLSINASTGEITGTPTNGDVGVTTITVRVTDGSGETAQTNFDLTVDNVNDVPTVSSIANNTATEDLAFSYDVSGSFDDVDLIHGDTLTYSLEGSPPGWLSINASTGEITGTPTNGDVGVTTITVRVTDGSGETAQTNFDLTVDNVNDVPTVSSIANNTATEDLAFSYDVSGSFDDVDLIHGDTLTYSLEGSPPGWLSINASTGEIT